MGLMEKLRKAEEQGKEAARNALERAREFGEDAERRIRQKMRIYPPNAANNSGEASQTTGTGAVARRSPVESPVPEETPIISIRGEDVEGADKVA